MRIYLNETHISIINQVMPDLVKPASPLCGSVEETLITLVLIEWHQKNIAKLTYRTDGFKAAFSDSEGYAMCALIQCTMMPEAHDAIEFSALLSEIVKRLPRVAFKKFSEANSQSLKLINSI